MNAVYIQGDSRLKNFDSYINAANTENLPIYVEAENGARLQQLCTNTINCLHRHREAFVIIAGGINDCTFKDMTTGKYMYNFTCSDNMVKHVMGQLEDIDKRIRDIHPTAKIAYSDIIGMDMLAYKWCNDPTPEQQYAFNVAIMEINRMIVQFNVQHSILTPWLAKTVHIPRKYGVSHVYERLIDGLHWDEDLKTACAKRLVCAASKLLQ